MAELNNLPLVFHCKPEQSSQQGNRRQDQKHHHSPDRTQRRAHRVRLLTAFCSQGHGGLLCPHLFLV
ncbi:unnamed protein product [Arctogadus glacialis]